MKYRALRFASTLMRVFGWILVVAGAILAVSALRDSLSSRGVADAVPELLKVVMGAFLPGLFAVVYADLILLLLDIETNTRAAAYNTERTVEYTRNTFLATKPDAESQSREQAPNPSASK